MQSSLFAAGTITGQGRFEKIAGNPSAGYQHLYEWDLFLSPADDSFIGPFMRLGAPPNQNPTGDGYYRFNNVPAGTYSLLINQPDFFASPKVIPNVQLADGETKTLNIDLDVDYSTYFSDSGKWTVWEEGPSWYQTFVATGTSVRGVSWKMAGWGLYNGQRAEVSILQDNGDSDVRNWKQIGFGQDNNLNADSDEWVRWNSGDIPLTPGTKYAVKIWVSNGCAIYFRNKDSQSYSHGQAYNNNGDAKNFDLNITVFVDKDNQMITHTRKSSGPGQFNGNLNSTQWGQTFVAAGTSLASVDVFAAGEDVAGIDVFHLTWTIHKDGPGGQQIGPAKSTYGAYYASSTDLIGVSYNPGDIPLVQGNTYYIEFTNPRNFTPFTQEAWNAYDDGQAYKNGTATGEDLAMTIIEYNHVVYEPVGFAGYWTFDQTTDDSSGNNNTADLINMENNWVDGIIDSALEFDGIEDYVRITDYKGITGSHPRTCAAWIKTGVGDADIIGWGKAGQVGSRWLVRLTAEGLLRVEVGGGLAVGSTMLTDANFHHIAVVSASDTTGEIKLYVDAKLETLSSFKTKAIKTESFNDVTIGTFDDSGNYFQGTIDDVALFDKALSQKQIKQLSTMSGASFFQPCGGINLNDNFRIDGDIDKDCNVNLNDLSILTYDWLAMGVLPGDIIDDEIVNFADVAALADNYLTSIIPGLMAYFRFDETTGPTAFDSSPNRYDAKVIGSDDRAWVSGKTGNALQFDGIGDGVLVTGYKGIGGSNPRTVCAWIKTTDTEGEIVSWGQGGIPGGRWVFRTQPEGVLRVEIGGGAIVGSTIVSDDQWHHIAAVLEEGSANINEVKLYVDGVIDRPSFVGEKEIDTVIDSETAPDLYINARPGSTKYFAGKIDEVRIYSRALSQQEIEKLVNSD